MIKLLISWIYMLTSPVTGCDYRKKKQHTAPRAHSSAHCDPHCMRNISLDYAAVICSRNWYRPTPPIQPTAILYPLQSTFV